jgi:AraC-like DNA-binding protein
MARAAGVVIGPMLVELGLPEDLFERQGELRIPFSAYFRLQHLISIAVEDETCQLSPRQHLPGTMDFVLSHLQGATTPYEAMKILASYYNLLHGGEYNSVRRRGDVVQFVMDDSGFPYTLKNNAEYLRFSMESVHIFAHCMLATIAPAIAAEGLRRIGITRAHSEQDADHLAFWTVPIEYGSEAYFIEYAADAAMRPLVLPPPALLTANRVYAQVVDMIAAREAEGASRHDFASLVRDGLQHGVVDQRRIAGLLGVSIATLRRRLAEEGTSFRALRKDVLNRTAQGLLKKRRPIADVAEALGFSEFRSFNRAFKEWNGMTPRAFIDKVDPTLASR